MALFRDKKLENELANLKKTIEERFDWQRRSLERRDSSISQAVNNPRFDEIEGRISDLEQVSLNECQESSINKLIKQDMNLEERISDLERENREMEVFKDFVEQLIRETSDFFTDINMYIDGLQKVLKNASELTDENPYHSHTYEEKSEDDAED